MTAFKRFWEMFDYAGLNINDGKDVGCFVLFYFSIEETHLKRMTLK